MPIPRISLQLKAARRRLGLSQAELGGRAGMSQSHVSRLEGGHDFYASTLERLATFLGHEVVLVPRHLAPGARRWIEEPGRPPPTSPVEDLIIEDEPSDGDAG